VKRKRVRSLPTSRKAVPAQIVPRLRLNAIRLVYSECSLRLSENAPKQTKLSITRSFGPAADGDGFRGELALDLTSEQDRETSPAIVIRCKFQMVYSLAKGPQPTKQQVKAEEDPIASMVGFQGWPYVREFVHSTTLKMGLPPLVLPPVIVMVGNKPREVKRIGLSKK
jgi:hypothetical protein